MRCRANIKVQPVARILERTSLPTGGGKFRVIGYRNGLPGAGWDGDRDDLYTGTGKTEDGKVTFTSGEGDWTAAMEDGKLVVYDDIGNEITSLSRVVRTSPSLGAKAPEGATVLFDGSNADAWKNGRMTEDGLLMQGVTSKETFGDFSLHIEFMLPYQPYARGQGRGNSGFYAQGRYEVQMLDSFGLEGKHNECGGIYSVKDPDVNMCLPPLQWQTYDVDFTAARFDAEGKKTTNARATVVHNGVVIHKDVEIDHSTTASPLKEGPEPGPIYLQNHGNPVCVIATSGSSGSDRDAFVRFIGVVHLQALPGAPRYAGDLEAVIDAAVADAVAYEKGGADALIIENFGDVPFTRASVPAVTIAAMSAAGRAAVAAVNLPIGFNVLRNDGSAALGLCAACNGRFARVNVLTGAAVTDQGLVEGDAFSLLREREALCPGVKIFADVHVKHAAPLGVSEIGQAAQDTLERGLADGLIISGVGTGSAVNLGEAERVREACPEAMLLIGSGATTQNAAELLQLADGLIVGSSLKEGGDLSAPVDLERVRAMRAAVDSARR